MTSKLDEWEEIVRAAEAVDDHDTSAEGFAALERFDKLAFTAMPKLLAVARATIERDRAHEAVQSMLREVVGSPEAPSEEWREAVSRSGQAEIDYQAALAAIEEAGE